MEPQVDATVGIRHRLSRWITPPQEPLFEQQRSQALDTFAKEGLLRYGSGGEIVVAVDKWKRGMDFNALRDKLGPLGRRKKVTTLNEPQQIPVLTRIFTGLTVYSEEDYARHENGEEIKPKPLFYIPENSKAAVDADKIKRSDFYLGLWELRSSYRPENYPTSQEGFDSDVSMQEGIVAALIFHPRFGAGQRDEEGKLVVTYKDGTRRPITGDFFKSWGYTGNPRSENLTLSRPAEFFIAAAPHLVDAGLIKPFEDFIIAQGTQTQERVGAGIQTPTYKGLIMIDQVRYTLGEEFSGKKGFRVRKLSDRYAVIIKRTEEGDWKVEQLFELAPAKSQRDRLYRASGEQDYERIGKSKISFISPEAIVDKPTELTLLVRNFEELLAFSRKTSKEAGFSLINFTSDEQAVALGMYFRYGDDARFWQYLKQYKQPGISALMLFKDLPENINTVLEIASITDAGKLIKEAQEIQAATSSFETNKSDSLSDIDRKLLKEAMPVIKNYAQRLFLSAAPVMNGEVAGVDIYDVGAVLAEFRRNVSAFYNRYGENGGGTTYADLLNVFARRNDREGVETLVLALLKRHWTQDVVREGQVKIVTIMDELDKFYRDNPAVFATASETTADTKAEIAQWEEFVDRESIGGTIADLGSGPGRLTKLKAKKMLGRANIVGIDLFPPQQASEPNLTYTQGNLMQIPLPDSSVDLADADWSVTNDFITRGQQLESFAEVARILKEGGWFRLDVPDLHGGQGSWLPAVETYHQVHPSEKFGMVEGQFPFGSKLLYIYSEAELEALLVSQGFDVARKLKWRTEGGKPRLTFEAKLTHKITPGTIF